MERDHHGRFVKGHKSWSKGLTKETDKRLKEAKNYLKGNSYPSTGFKKGNHASKKTEFKKGYKHTEENIKNISNTLKGRKLSKEHRDKVIKNLVLLEKGKGHPMYGRFGKKHHNYKNLPKGRLYELYINKRLSLSDTSKLLNCSTRTVVRRLGLFNIPTRNLKETRTNQIIPIKDTRIEVKIQNFLKELGIEFFTHQYMKDIEHSYQCDILIPALNIVIECDGDYWHKYPVGLEKDHIRTKELIEKGFKVLRLWECEIKEMDINKFRGRLDGGDKKWL